VEFGFPLAGGFQFAVNCIDEPFASPNAREISEMDRVEQNAAIAAQGFDPRGSVGSISVNPADQRAQDLARKVARSNVTVVIGGEIGTGTFEACWPKVGPSVFCFPV
jgi:DNA-binding NtrC family response regulator